MPHLLSEARTSGVLDLRGISMITKDLPGRHEIATPVLSLFVKVCNCIRVSRRHRFAPWYRQYYRSADPGR